MRYQRVRSRPRVPSGRRTAAASRPTHLDAERREEPQPGKVGRPADPV
ncbi:hypothetical protein ABK046_07840 [Streptomyces caeruleatus]